MSASPALGLAGGLGQFVLHGHGAQFGDALVVLGEVLVQLGAGGLEHPLFHLLRVHVCWDSARRP